jgi:hypothetical protein
LIAAAFGLIVSSKLTTHSVHAFSAGPPAGYTGAPGEEPEACAECHVPPDAGTGRISITAPQTYIPGQTYPITVTHTNSDPTRLRWGFELTVLDTSDEKAGNLQNTDGLTQVLNNQGPGGSRQYIEHTSVGHVRWSAKRSELDLQLDGAGDGYRTGYVLYRRQSGK